ncbi:MAG: nucleoside deaminase [Microbacteriaceae bacterium]|nr:nucleoside deaminase [Microbacteriaceae bacterium]
MSYRLVDSIQAQRANIGIRLCHVKYENLMGELIELASKAQSEVPVAAAIIDSAGKVLSITHNKTIELNDPTAHAEIIAMREASKKLSSWRLENCTLVVTLEPCVMCAGAIKTARIPRVVFGAWDERVGGSGSRYDILRDSRLGPEVEVIAGVREKECSELLSNYFKSLRD